MRIGNRIKNAIGIEGSVKDSLLPMMAYNSYNISWAGNNQLQVFYTMFLARVEGLGLARTGTIVLFRSLVDAFIDPFLGMMSDRTRSRWGKHRPYIFLGALPFGITCFLMWTSFGISDSGNVGRLMLYYILANMLFMAVNSFINVPHTAMLPELAPDYFQRTQYISVQYIFNSVGMLPAQLLAAAFLGFTTTAEFSPSLRPTFRTMALIFSVVSIFPILATALFTKEKSSENLQRPDMNIRFLVREYRSVFHNRAFVQFFVMRFLLVFGTRFFTSGITRNFFITETAGAGEFLVLITFWAGAAEMLAFPLNYGLTKKIGKAKMGWATIPFWFASLALTLFIGPNMLPLLFVQELLAPFGSSGINWAVQNIQPDVTDVDEMITGRRREGAMTAVDNLIRTSTEGVLTYIIGIILEFFGIEGSVSGYEGDGVMFSARAANIVGPRWGGPNAGMRLVRGVLPMIFIGLTMLALRRFTMTKDDHKLIQELIKEKHENGMVEITDKQKARMEEIAGQKWEDMWIGRVESGHRNQECLAGVSEEL